MRDTVCWNLCHRETGAFGTGMPLASLLSSPNFLKVSLGVLEESTSWVGRCGDPSVLPTPPVPLATLAPLAPQLFEMCQMTEGTVGRSIRTRCAQVVAQASWDSTILLRGQGG
jgi:hypothetical protein